MINFNNYTDEELRDYLSDYTPDTDNYSLLEVVEEIASDEKMISSEQDLSNAYDQMLEETGFNQWDDATMIRCGFSDWADSLLSDGLLHEEQVNNYCYIGKHEV